MLPWCLDTTICAISSGALPLPARGAVSSRGSVAATRGIVRVSGPDALNIVARCQPLDSRSTSSECLGTQKSPRRYRTELSLGQPLGTLEVTLWVWPDHRSYTGQPSVEIHTIASPPILHGIVEQLCLHGATMAQPGEFTFRAFSNGRLDLAQCEAVLGVIDARTAKGLDSALRQLAGGLQLPLSRLRQYLIELLADIEAGLDFAEEGIEFLSREAIEKTLENAIDQMNSMLEQMRGRTVEGNAPVITILGAPNAGKSSLMNRLAGYQASIVSEQSGTTRDFVRYPMSRLPLTLIDTAGVEEFDMSHPRGMAQEKVVQQWRDADLRCWCIDLSTPEWSAASQHEMAIHWMRAHPVDENESPEVWWLGTKVDRPSPESLSWWNSFSSDPDPIPTIHWMRTTQKRIACSSQSEAGVHCLYRELESWLLSRNAEEIGVVPATLLRCRESLRIAIDSLHNATLVLKENGGDEWIAAEIRLALDSLGIVSGEVYTEEILDNLFRRFCIGK